MTQRPIDDQRLNLAIRYLLQLAIEFETDGAAYADGAAVLAQVVEALERHQAHRIAVKRVAAVAEVVEPIHEQLKLHAGGAITKLRMYETISKWLGRRGIVRTHEELEAAFSRRPRSGARSRTDRERLLEQLAAIVDVSQSQFEKVVGVAERGKATSGRLGTLLDHERAARDEAPTRTELLLRLLHALNIDAETGRRIVDQLPAMEVELVHNSISDRVDAAEILAAAKRAKKGRPTSSSESPGVGEARDPLPQNGDVALRKKRAAPAGYAKGHEAPRRTGRSRPEGRPRK